MFYNGSAMAVPVYCIGIPDSKAKEEKMGRPGVTQRSDKSEIGVKHLKPPCWHRRWENIFHNSYFSVAHNILRIWQKNRVEHSAILYFTKVHLKISTSLKNYFLPVYNFLLIMVYRLVFFIMVCVLVWAHRP